MYMVRYGRSTSPSQFILSIYYNGTDSSCCTNGSTRAAYRGTHTLSQPIINSTDSSKLPKGSSTHLAAGHSRAAVKVVRTDADAFAARTLNDKTPCLGVRAEKLDDLVVKLRPGTKSMQYANFLGSGRRSSG